MSDQIKVKERPESPQISPTESVGADACQVQKTGLLKGWLPMAICCGAPLLLLLAIPFFGAAFGSLAALGTGLLSFVAVLACPLGMYLMMRMMMKNKK